MNKYAFALIVFLFALHLNAELFKDTEYNYQIEVPDVNAVKHFPHKNHNLTFTNADSTAWFYVYALDVSEEPGDELLDDNKKIIYKESFVDGLDRKIFNVGDSIVYTKEGTLINRVERRYQLPDGNEGITVTYFHEENPHIVAVFGKDLERPEIRQTLDSFRTKNIDYSLLFLNLFGWGGLIIVGIGIIVDKIFPKSNLIKYFVGVGLALIILFAINSQINFLGRIWCWF